MRTWVILSGMPFEANMVVEGKSGLQVAPADVRESRTPQGKRGVTV